MNSIFQGTTLDIYIHWLILVLGIVVLVTGGAVLFSCRSIAGAFGLLKEEGTSSGRLYRAFYRYHSSYWIIFWIVLTMHLMVTITHLGLPTEPYLLAHQIAFGTAISNFVLMGVVFFSCRVFTGLLRFVIPSWKPGRCFGRFFKTHSIFWWLLGSSITVHIVSGMIHAVNT